jgi:hypothetical protein
MELYIRFHHEGLMHIPELNLYIMKKTSLLLLTFLFSTLAFSQTLEEEKAAIAKTVDLYFEGMMEGDLEKLDLAFDSHARLIGYLGENFMVIPYQDWASEMAKAEKLKPTDFSNKLIDIDLKGYTAMAKTEGFWPGTYYFDYLTLVKIDGIWKIVHKTWYEEKR